MRSFILLAFLAASFRLATGQSGGGAFIYPPPANAIDNSDSNTLPEFVIGQTIQLRWSSNLETISIGLRHISDNIILLGSGAVQGSILDEKANTNGTRWVVSLANSKPKADVNNPTYYLAALSPDRFTYFTSNYFTVKASSDSDSNSNTNSESSTTQTSTRSSTAGSNPTPTPSTSSTTSTSSETSTTPAQTSGVGSQGQNQDQNTSGDSGLSTGAKVGLGVSIPLAVIALATAAWFLYRRGVQKGAAEREGMVPAVEKDGAGVGSYNGSGNAGGVNGYYAPVKPQAVVGELNGGQQGWVHELPAEHGNGNGRGVGQLP